MQQMQQSQDRVLHMSDICRDHLNKVRSWAIINGVHDKLLEGLDYLRTYSGGPESDWKSQLSLDFPHRQDDKSFICTISRRRKYEQNGEQKEYLSPFMTIGMIWREAEKEWTFHS